MELPELIQDGVPEIAFVGRSNSGKSSLLNAMCSRKSLARVSKTPGRTQAINLFAMDIPLRFADLPGYGYAKVAASVRKHWRQMLGDYLLTRDCLAAIVVVHDSRRKISEEERWFFDHCEAPAILALSKTDKLKKSELSSVVKKIVTELGVDKSQVVPVSVLKANDPGLQTILESIVDSLEFE
ncbi:UNVERIFIED_CONTAM: hypothetical protein GTU68_062720 [Idotea baltica]|nr:hypothetical protein [Idotea baltica]